KERCRLKERMRRRPYVFVVVSRKTVPLGLLLLVGTLLVTGLVVWGSETAPLTGVTVVVDPGHGDHDRGACHLPTGLIEKEINLDIARRVGARLEAAGARVTMTRTGDTFLSLDAR